MTFVKSAPKKSFAQKTDFFRTNFQLEKQFFGQNFFWVHFLLRSYAHFWNQYEKTDFFMPHSTYSKKKIFHLLEGTMNFFES